MKCKKCGIYYKDRKDPEEEKAIHRELCFNCSVIWKMISNMIGGLSHYSQFSRLNRIVEINIDNIEIKKPKKLCDTKK